MAGKYMDIVLLKGPVGGRGNRKESFTALETKLWVSQNAEGACDSAICTCQHPPRVVYSSATQREMATPTTRRPKTGSILQ